MTVDVDVLIININKVFIHYSCPRETTKNDPHVLLAKNVQVYLFISP